MIDYKNIGDSQVTKAHKRQKRRNRSAMFTTADLVFIGLCAFTTLYLAIRAY